MLKTFRILVFGLVQGVNFRHQTKRIAESMGIVGFVKNKPDGSVEIIAQGSLGRLNSFKEMLKTSIKYAKITRIIVKEINLEGRFENFEVLY